MPRRLLLLAALTACTPSTSSTAPTRAAPSPPAIHDLEVQRESATAVLLERSLRGPDVLLAIRALGRVADPIALSQLNTLLTAPATRAAAARALGSAKLLGADIPEAESALLTAWQTTTDLTDRIAIAEALGRLGTTAAIPTLTAALRDGPAELREPAAIALGVLTRRGIPLDDPARAALVALADVSDPALQYAVAYALAHEHEPSNREATDAAIIRLTAARNPETRAVAVMGLTRRKLDSQQTRPLFHTALNDRDFRVRTAAVRGLLAIADDAALLHLLAWARKSLADPSAIHPTLELLDNLLKSKLPQKPGQPPAWSTHVDLLVREATLLLKTPTAARIACQARAVLARAGDTHTPLTCPGQPPHLATVLSTESLADDRLEALLHDPDPRIRSAAAAAMLAHHSAANLLLDLLADPSPAVVGTLADALASKDPPTVTDALRTALAARATAELTREVELYTSLTAAIAAIKAPVEPCTAGLTHPNFAVRAAARTCVTTLTGTDPGPQLPTQSPPRPPHAPSPGPHLHWRLTTNRGVVDIDLDPSAAPWHVAALAANTRAGFYDGLTFHRVVPGFVVQGGDPEGTGWGGPGYTLPSEPTTARFTRGAVGIADAGKDTGGCQFFIMHARAPHLEGRFTWVGEVTRGQEIVDTLLVSDSILRAELIP